MEDREKGKMGQRYYTDALSNYLIMPCGGTSADGYQFRMLAANRIPGLLPCSTRTVDGEHYLYYEITSRETLEMMTGNSVMGGKELENFLYVLASVIRSLSDFLLDETCLILRADYIYYDFEKEQFNFVYYPEEKGERQFTELFRYLADHIDPGDDVSAAVVYHLCDLAEKESFVLNEEVLEREYEFAGSVYGTDERRDRYEEDEWRETACTEKSCDRRLQEQNERRKSPAKDRERKPGGILALAVFFLVVAALLEGSRFIKVYSESQEISVHAGIVACLGMALTTAVYGTFFTWRKGRQEEKAEYDREQERRNNAMMPASEFGDPAERGPGGRADVL